MVSIIKYILRTLKRRLLVLPIRAKKKLDVCAKLNNYSQSEFTMIELYIYTLTFHLMGGAY